ncbi:MAG: hypothetical protein PHD40_00200 [Syntrophomonadaceae bacterium]|nr:hypothetical protein [Syntrophomonadaceae bacterium]
MLLVKPERESWRKLFYPIRSQIKVTMLIPVILAVVLNSSGCYQVSPEDNSTTVINPSSQTPVEPLGTTDIVQNQNNIAPPETDKLQSARNILFAYQPEWRDLEAQGKRTIEGGFATMVIDTEQQPGNIFVFHVYDIIEYPDESHNATYGWFEINTDTGEVYDSILNERVY